MKKLEKKVAGLLRACRFIVMKHQKTAAVKGGSKASHRGASSIAELFRENGESLITFFHAGEERAAFFVGYETRHRLLVRPAGTTKILVKIERHQIILNPDNK